MSTPAITGLAVLDPSLERSALLATVFETPVFFTSPGYQECSCGFRAPAAAFEHAALMNMLPDSVLLCPSCGAQDDASAFPDSRSDEIYDEDASVRAIAGIIRTYDSGTFLGSHLTDYEAAAIAMRLVNKLARSTSESGTVTLDGAALADLDYNMADILEQHGVTLIASVPPGSADRNERVLALDRLIDLLRSENPSSRAARARRTLETERAMLLRANACRKAA